MKHQGAISRLFAVGSVLLCMACLEEAPALFIIHNNVLDANCSSSGGGASNVYRPHGVMDLTVADTYWMFPEVENLMSPSGSASLGGGVPGGYEGNRVTMSHAQVGFTPPASFEQAMPTNLQIAISGTMEPGEILYASIEIINKALSNQLLRSQALSTRGGSVPVDVSVQFFGTTTSGTEVESNVFTYPLLLCRDCLLDFPPAATDFDDVLPNCRAVLAAAEAGETTTVNCGCFPGQDEPLDCRCCRAILMNRGISDSEVEASCEPLRN